MTRKYTTMLIDIVDEGIMDAKDALLMCVNYMSEADVEDMCHCNDIFTEDEQELLDVKNQEDL